MFEIWLYYHAYDIKPNPADVDKHTSFKEFVGSKFNGGFNMKLDPERIRIAIKNAQANHLSTTDEPDIYETEVYQLGNEVIKYLRK